VVAGQKRLRSRIRRATKPAFVGAAAYTAAQRHAGWRTTMRPAADCDTAGSSVRRRRAWPDRPSSRPSLRHRPCHAVGLEAAQVRKDDEEGCAAQCDAVRAQLCRAPRSVLR
jgi:hypothetical protein